MKIVRDIIDGEYFVIFSSSLRDAARVDMEWTECARLQIQGWNDMQTRDVEKKIYPKSQ